MLFSLTEKKFRCGNSMKRPHVFPYLNSQDECCCSQVDEDTALEIGSALIEALSSGELSSDSAENCLRSVESCMKHNKEVCSGQRSRVLSFFVSHAALEQGRVF